MVKHGHAAATPEHPVTLGHEISGVVSEVGPQVTGWQRGDRVAIAPNYGCGSCDLCVQGNTHLCPDYRALGIHVDGGFAEQVLVPAEAVRQGNVQRLCDRVTFAEASLIEPLSCVLNAFERAMLQPGDSVLVMGAGPIGLMHARMALLGGAGRVILNDPNTDRLSFCRGIEPRLETVAIELPDFVRAATSGRGVNVVITACAAPAAQQLALELAAVNGRVIFFGGLPHDRAQVALHTNLIHYRQLWVTGTTRSSLDQYRRTLRLIETRQLRVDDLVTATFPLADIPRAIASAAGGLGLRNQIQFS
jgi:L-iditol 2-dehydrogenase